MTATFGSRAYATRDRGANWVLVIDLPVCSQLSISFDGVSPGRAYASACGELLTTEDGFQWGSRASTLPADTRALRSVHGDLYARTESEVFRSRDRGDSWVPIVRAPAICPTITAFAVDPEDSEVLYVATGKAAPMRFVCGGLYKSPDGGGNLYRTALPDQYITSILVDPADSGRVYTTSVQTGFFSPLAAIFRSLDGGLSWENFNGRTFGQAGIAISATGKVLYAVSNGGVFRREIAKRRSLPPR